MRNGDSIVFDIFIPMPYYWCDMTRTVFFRSASDEARRVYETVRAANLAADAVIRPGAPMREFDHAAREVIEKAGYGPYFTHRLGHGIGLECHEPPDNSSVSEVIAEPGMVFSLEPGIYLPGKLGVRIEDLVLVTETGCEAVSYTHLDVYKSQLSEPFSGSALSPDAEESTISSRAASTASMRASHSSCALLSSGGGRACP